MIATSSGLVWTGVRPDIESTRDEPTKNNPGRHARTLATTFHGKMELIAILSSASRRSLNDLRAAASERRSCRVDGGRSRATHGKRRHHHCPEATGVPDVNWNSVDHLSFAGTDLQELSASLSYLHNGEVRRESRGTTKYRIDLVGTQGISIIASSYDGAFTIHFPASIDTATILIPLTGNAIVAVTDRKIPSIQNLGVFVDRLQNYELHVAGPRRHLCFRVPHDELVRRIEVRLNISVRGRLQFANEIDLSQGPGFGFGATRNDHA
ncbi:hypothetical protein ELH88_37935 [Rhizobium ruizarguesonis]|nr:hypothetical protein ELH87_39115 [Rhizobium ruizarguesonis]TAY41324.1 hypothetical protein ELH88_37935 [Rhizobium ruizarguesonis]TBY68820.1 hypothetical protein E0H46_14635 [Rhizobium leguminosarum bv. viciae]TBY85368.1 hypothetical protein E0H40_28210 [Rhizobium leguminosarum bv. viciae]